MKTLRMIGMAIIAIIMCVNLTACSDDDDDFVPVPKTELINTVWTGVNPYSKCGIEVNIQSAALCVISVYLPNSTNLHDQEKVDYIYSDVTGAFSCEYDNYKINGRVLGNKLQLTDRYGTYYLYRK